MFITPMTESGILCQKKMNFMVSSYRPRYKGCAALYQWRLVAHHGDIRKSKLLPFSTCISILTYYSWFQVHHYSPWHVFPSDCFVEKCSKRVIIVELIMQILEGAIWLNAVLQAEEFPACISYLNSSLANMDRDALTLRRKSRGRVRKKQGTSGILIPSGYFFPLYCFSKNNGDLLLSAFHLVVQPRDCNETVHYIHTRYWDSSLKN